jgi:hypothetical protein
MGEKRRRRSASVPVAGGSSVFDVLDFEIQTVADLAPITHTCSQQFARLFRGLSFNAPFFRTRDVHGRVEGPEHAF